MRKLLSLPVVSLIVLIPLAVIMLVVANPYPGPITLDDMYTNVAYQLLGRQSEHGQDAYVTDLLSNLSQGTADEVSERTMWDNKLISPESQSILAYDLAKVLPASTTTAEKWIEINLSEQKLYAHEGDAVVRDFLISSGKKWTPTPTGEFRIWVKVKSQTMKGGSKETGDYYYLPNVTNVMYFYKGYGIHTAYWHNNFGHPMSHGCINMRAADAEWMYNWANPVVPEGKSWYRPTDDNPGTRVLVHT